MKKIFFAWVLSAILSTGIACSSHKTASSASAQKAKVEKKEKAQKTSEKGKSFETAIKVNDVPEEYAYVRKVCPTCRFVSQSLVKHNNKYYDVLTFKKSALKTVKFYFDISSFYPGLF